MPDEQQQAEQNHKDGLSKAREAQQLAKTAKNAAEVAATGSPTAALSLAKDAFSIFKQIDMLGDMPFFLAIGAAVLKDVIDLITFETIILPFITSICCGIFIFMMLYLGGATDKKRKAKKLMGKGLTILFGSALDFIPGLDIVPIETITVLAVYVWVLFDRKNAQASQ